MGRNVLVVDDVAFVRKTLVEILRAAHFQIVGEAADGSEAVDLYQKLHPDIVTMDIVMPKMSGIDAIRRIVKHDKDARVVVISAMGQENLVMEAINVGARDYILKPFTGDEVIKTLERALVSEDHAGSRGQREQKAGL